MTQQKQNNKEFNIQLVKQEESKGCTIACLAMVLNKTYAEVRSDFSTNFSKQAISGDLMVQYLADKGYSVINKEPLRWSTVDQFRDELFKPFAPIHIVHFIEKADLKNSHVVVMDENGEFYCPDGLTRVDILHCYRVIQTLGIWKD